jgi:ribonuclease Z
MDLRLVFLGTAGAVPTIERAPSGILIVRGGERILVDCGEGTQRQLMRSVGMSRIDRVLITHLHGDHYLGLPGLLKTLSLMGREEPLQILGPPGLEEMFQVAHRLFGRFAFPLLVEEVPAGFELPLDGYRLRTVRTDHGLPSVGWMLVEAARPGRFHPERAVEAGVTPGPDFRRLQMGETLRLADGRTVRPQDVMDAPRQGRTIVITGDTRPAATVLEAARGATILVHESTFTEDEQERAAETRHSTAGEAAGVAHEAGVGLLVLTHLSSRHSARALVEEARRVFPAVLVPSDLDHLVVPYPDKGAPVYLPGGEELPES